MSYKLLVEKISKDFPDLENLFRESNRRPVTVTFCNPLSFKILKHNKEYQKYLEAIDFIYSDGMLLCSFIEKVTRQKCIRASFDGNSIATQVFQLCKNYNKRVALVGTTDEHIVNAVEKLSDKLNIVYYRNGFFSSDEEINCFFDALEANKVDTIIFGMGAPYQERMLHLLKQRKFNGLAFTCGGYLEQLARKDILYYPEFFNKYNLRWLYRILDEPGKLLRRYIFDYSSFYIEYIKFVFANQWMNWQQPVLEN